MKLWFENSAGGARVIADIDGKKDRDAIQKEALKHIRAFCNERNFVIYYVRIWDNLWRQRPATVFDVGSHTEFFYLTGDENDNEVNSV